MLHTDLDMQKISAKWIPKCLIGDQKRAKVEIGTRSVEGPDFLNRVITMDETWLNFYDPETKQQSMEWRHSGSPKSAGKVFASVFWDLPKVIMVDYLEKGKSITGEYYSSLLQRYAKKLWKQGANIFLKGFCFCRIMLLHTNRASQRIQFMIWGSKRLTILLVLRI